MAVAGLNFKQPGEYVDPVKTSQDMTKASLQAARDMTDANMGAYQKSMDYAQQATKKSLEMATQNQAEMEKATEGIISKNKEMYSKATAESKLYSAKMMFVGAMSSLAMVFSTMLMSVGAFISASLGWIVSSLLSLFSFGYWNHKGSEMKETINSAVHATPMMSAGVRTSAPAAENAAKSQVSPKTVMTASAASSPYSGMTLSGMTTNPMELPGMLAQSYDWDTNPWGAVPMDADAKSSKQQKLQGFSQIHETTDGTLKTIGRHESNV